MVSCKKKIKYVRPVFFSPPITLHIMKCTDLKQSLFVSIYFSNRCYTRHLLYIIVGINK